MLLNDIEIAGVPEHPGESPLHITQPLAQQVGMQLDTRDVVSVERVGPLKVVSVEVGPKPRPRPFVVRLTRRPIRDELLRSACVRRNLDTNNIGLPEHNSCRVYLNETHKNQPQAFMADASGSLRSRLEVRMDEGGPYLRQENGMQ